MGNTASCSEGRKRNRSPNKKQEREKPDEDHLSTADLTPAWLSDGKDKSKHSDDKVAESVYHVEDTDKLLAELENLAQRVVMTFIGIMLE